METDTVSSAQEAPSVLEFLTKQIKLGMLVIISPEGPLTVCSGICWWLCTVDFEKALD